VVGLSPTLQIRQMLRPRSSRDFSVASFVVLNVGFLLWLSYGLSIGNLAVAIPNVVAFTVGVTTVVVALRLRQSAAVSEPTTGPVPSRWLAAPRSRCDEPARAIPSPSSGSAASSAGRSEGKTQAASESEPPAAFFMKRSFCLGRVSARR